jgi:hypothetical protein
MVVILEILFLIVGVVLGLWWFSRTSRWSQMKSEHGRGQDDRRREKHEFNRTQDDQRKRNFRVDGVGGPQKGPDTNWGGGGAL